jgi:uncharacterized membrane protein YciS (DUF1049 family)
MKKVKMIIVLVISLIAVTVFFQNTEIVETRLLFAKIAMPRFLLLISTFIMGFIVGLITMSYFQRRSRKKTS